MHTSLERISLISPHVLPLDGPLIYSSRVWIIYICKLNAYTKIVLPGRDASMNTSSSRPDSPQTLITARKLFR